MVHCSREGAGKANRSKVWHVEIPIAYVGENGLHLFEWNQIYGAGWIRVTLRTRRRLHSKMTLLPWPTRMAVGTIPTTMMTTIEWTDRSYLLAREVHLSYFKDYAFKLNDKILSQPSKSSSSMPSVVPSNFPEKWQATYQAEQRPQQRTIVAMYGYN